MELEDARNLAKEFMIVRSCQYKYTIKDRDGFFCRDHDQCKYFMLDNPASRCGYFSQLEVAVQVLKEAGEPL
jgi:hypothetical protein